MCKNKNRKSIFIMIVLFIVILFYCYNALYTHPQTDDYYFANMSIDSNFIQSQVNIYNTYNGRYISSPLITLLMSIKPITTLLIVYKMISFIMILLMIFSIFILSNTIFGKYVDKLKILLFTFVISIIYLSQMPSVNETIYWLTGSLSYHIGLCMLLIMIVLIVKFIKTNSGFKALYIILISLLVVFNCGISETLAISVMGTAFIAFILALIVNNKRLKKLAVFVFILSAVCFLFVASAPGNSVRSKLSMREAHNILYSVGYTLSDGVGYLLLWSTRITTIILFISVLLFANKFINFESVFKKFSNTVLLISILFVPLIVTAFFFPAYWATGSGPPPRMRNFIYFILLCGTVFSGIVISVLLYRNSKTLDDIIRKCSFKIILSVVMFLSLLGGFFPIFKLNNIFNIILHTVISIIAIIVIFAFYRMNIQIKSIFDAKDNLNRSFRHSTLVLSLVALIFSGNIPEVVYDSFTAWKFNDTLYQRYSLIKEYKENGVLNVVVPEVQNMPKIVWVDDITANPNDWRNKRVARYFRIESIKTTD